MYRGLVCLLIFVLSIAVQYIYLSVQAVPVPWPGLSPHIRAESRLLAVLRSEAAGAEEEGPVQ